MQVFGASVVDSEVYNMLALILYWGDEIIYWLFALCFEDTTVRGRK